MSLLTGFNITNIERVKAVTDDQTPVTHIWDTSSAATCTPAISAGSEQEQRIKNKLYGRLITEDVVQGYDIELTDERMNREILALCSGGENTEAQGEWTKYEEPAIGSTITRKSFTLYIYTSDRDTDSGVNSYHEFKFPGCKGKQTPALDFADGGFAKVKYSIRSRPASGAAPMTMTPIESLPTPA